MAFDGRIAEQSIAMPYAPTTPAAMVDSTYVAGAYDLYHASLYSFCLSRLSSRPAAEDVVQEAFARLSATARGSVTDPQAWLFTVARNLCADVGRHSTHFPLESGEGAERLENVSCGTDSSDEAMSREDASQLLLALRRLNPRYRTALILREVHGLSVPEIAEALETTEGATHTLLSRSRDALGKALADVSEAPQSCRRAMALAFKRSGTGITAAEDQRLEAHLEACPECRRRVRQAEGPRPLAALLPLLMGSGSRPVGLLARAIASLGDGALVPSLTSCVQPAAKTVGAMMLAVALLAPTTSALRETKPPEAPAAVATAAAGNEFGRTVARGDSLAAAGVTSQGAAPDATPESREQTRARLSGEAGIPSQRDAAEVNEPPRGQEQLPASGTKSTTADGVMQQGETPKASRQTGAEPQTARAEGEQTANAPGPGPAGTADGGGSTSQPAGPGATSDGSADSGTTGAQQGQETGSGQSTGGGKG